MELIDGLSIIAINKVHDHNGAELQFLRIGDRAFSGFGEAFFLYTKPDRVRGWDKFSCGLCLCVPNGTARIVVYDDRPGSDTFGKKYETVLGLAGSYSLLRIPPHVWFGFQSVIVGRGALAAIISDVPLKDAEHISARYDSLANSDGVSVHNW